MNKIIFAKRSMMLYVDQNTYRIIQNTVAQTMSTK